MPACPSVGRSVRRQGKQSVSPPVSQSAPSLARSLARSVVRRLTGLVGKLAAWPDTARGFGTKNALRSSVSRPAGFPSVAELRLVLLFA